MIHDQHEYVYDERQGIHVCRRCLISALSASTPSLFYCPAKVDRYAANLNRARAESETP